MPKKEFIFLKTNAGSDGFPTPTPILLWKKKFGAFLKNKIKLFWKQCWTYFHVSRRSTNTLYSRTAYTALFTKIQHRSCRFLNFLWNKQNAFELSLFFNKHSVEILFLERYFVNSAVFHPWSMLCSGKLLSS